MVVFFVEKEINILCHSIQLVIDEVLFFEIFCFVLSLDWFKIQANEMSEATNAGEEDAKLSTADQLASNLENTTLDEDKTANGSPLQIHY